MAPALVVAIYTVQLGGQIAFENYRARLNRIFDVGTNELYNPRKTT